MKLQLYSLLVCVGYFVVFEQGAALLPVDEVEALREIAQTLGKRDWNFSVDPCSGESGWVTHVTDNAVYCNCTYVNNTVCHVTNILLKAQNLPGVLPPELVKLPYLQQIDLTRNYLNGSIPKEWGSMQLVSISLLGNRLSGPIPPEIANITTLQEFVLEYNNVSGVLPPELGNWTSIVRLLICSNNFTGPLPETLAKLTTLKDFRISDNNFSGNIPNFIQNWVNLEKIAIQASGLEGPIPPSISLLTKMADMRISDLTGIDDEFPPISSMTKMKTLVLRRCNLIGQIPAYLGDMASMKTLDLSFNKLTGPLPSSLDSVANIDYLYLTGNTLTGPVPERITRIADNVDISYNNFTLGSSGLPSCQQQNVNLFGSSSMGNTSTGVVPCFRSYQCPKKTYSFHINCGGREFTAGGNTAYEEDIDSAGASKFFQSRYNWAFSSTGNFMDDDIQQDRYTVTNTSRLTMNDYQLYTTARLAPVSLTYYGFCLLKGNYTVNLQFAEITFTNDRSYTSLGRRIFDIYIQGKLVWKDFNIMDEAGGAGNEVIKKFIAVVTGTTLEIRFYWAGKGTAGIPLRGTYGPLVSAISVVPNFIPPSEHGKKISPGTVVGIALSVLAVIAMFLGVLWWNGCFREKSEISADLKGLDLQTGSFTLKQIKAATNNFDAANKIGEGGFGPVYKGLLLDGTIIAVKQLSSKSKQGNREFVNEIGMISALQHPHLVKLHGCCIEGNQLLLVYEYMENNSLARALFGRESQLKLDWPTRHKICIGIARALAYLHEESRLKIVHRDIKATNVLLDKDLNAKVSDFGLAKLDEAEDTHMSTRIAGTYGYMAPEYAMRGHLTDKADVYSFGVVALEIVSGRSNTSVGAKEERVHLLDWAQVLQTKGALLELVDPSLGSNYPREEVLKMIDVGLQCTNTTPTLRPLMSAVVSMLEHGTTIQKSVSLSSKSGDDTALKAMKNDYEQVLDESTTDVQTQSMSMGEPWTGSSMSEIDLYPVNPNTEYWEKREQMSP